MLALWSGRVKLSHVGARSITILALAPFGIGKRKTSWRRKRTKPRIAKRFQPITR
jgi:hypothetical protein